MRGFVANVYRSGTDCTNRGVSSWANTLLCCAMPQNVRQVYGMTNILNGEIWKISEDRPAVYIAVHMHHLIAMPVSALWDWPNGYYTRGGNFLYSTDSRFWDAPIPIHDRFEMYDETRSQGVPSFEFNDDPDMVCTPHNFDYNFAINRDFREFVIDKLWTPENAPSDAERARTPNPWNSPMLRWVPNPAYPPEYDQEIV
jgi:hypothetical protein